MNKGLITILLSLLIWTVPVLAEDSDELPPSANYFVIEEPFTLNFLNQSQQKVRYLQIKVALMSHDAALIELAKQNLPMIQDALRNLFADQNYESVSTLEGRKQLQKDALTLVKQLLTDETGNDKLEAIYFTSFILQ